MTTASPSPATATSTGAVTATTTTSTTTSNNNNNNILSSQGTYLKLITKPQGNNDDDQQALDVMLQKLKARGDEVEIKAIIGDKVLLEKTLQNQLNSCLKKSPSPSPARKRARLKFNLSQECDDEQ